MQIIFIRCVDKSCSWFFFFQRTESPEIQQTAQGRRKMLRWTKLTHTKWMLLALVSESRWSDFFSTTETILKTHLLDRLLARLLAALSLHN